MMPVCRIALRNILYVLVVFTNSNVPSRTQSISVALADNASLFASVGSAPTKDVL